jgi:hypothetical protein
VAWFELPRTSAAVPRRDQPAATRSRRAPWSGDRLVACNARPCVLGIAPHTRGDMSAGHVGAAVRAGPQRPHDGRRRSQTPGVPAPLSAGTPMDRPVPPARARTSLSRCDGRRVGVLEGRTARAGRQTNLTIALLYQRDHARAVLLGLMTPVLCAVLMPPSCWRSSHTSSASAARGRNETALLLCSLALVRDRSCCCVLRAAG